MRLFVITGTCGAGKSTMRDALPDLLDPQRWACVDSDEVGLQRVVACGQLGEALRDDAVAQRPLATVVPALKERRPSAYRIQPVVPQKQREVLPLYR